VATAKSNVAVRLIPFQASLGVTYVLEFGPGYIRFYNNGSPVLEAAMSVTAAATGPPEVFTSTAHGYSNGDWIFVQNNWYIVQGVTTNTFTLTDLFGIAINTNPFSLPANAQRFYTVTAPYQVSDLPKIKFAQNVNTLILCHPNYPAAQLVLNSTLTQPNWTFSSINFGSTIGPPAIPAANVTVAAGGTTGWIGYLCTSVDVNGQESVGSSPAVVSCGDWGVGRGELHNLNSVHSCSRIDQHQHLQVESESDWAATGRNAVRLCRQLHWHRLHR
jgi:hypothetical protein